MKHLLIILSFLLLSSPVIGHPTGGHTLYRWETSSGHKWLEFGEKDTHPKYTGHVKDGKPNGLGFLIYPNGYKYVGSWKNGEYHGQGTDTSPDGSNYVGEYKDGVYHGQGTLTWSNGEKYVGEWKDRKRTGQGTYTYPCLLYTSPSPRD